MRILIADDIEINRRLMAASLKAYGSIDFASDGEQAVQKFIKAHAEGNPYKLLCLDLVMPEKEGAEALDEIRNIEKEKGINEKERLKVIIVTSYAYRDNVMKTYTKCQGYIVKPIQPKKIFEKMSALNFAPLEENSAYSNWQKTQSASPRPPPEKNKKEYNDEETIEKNISDEAVQKAVLIAGRDSSYAVIISGPEENREIPWNEYEGFKSVYSGDPIGRPAKKDILKAGEGVVLLASKNIFVARRNGRAVIENAELRIEQTLVINENLRHGKVKFPGKIVLNGDVRDSVTVKAGEGMEINGTAGGCRLISGGDISIRRMHGNGKGIVKSGGNLDAGFIYDTEAHSEGNINVERESINSSLKSKDSIMAGSVVGGECTARNVVEIDKAGSPNDSSTLVRAGFDFDQADKARILEKDISDAERKIREYERMLGIFAKEPCKAFLMPEEKREKLMRLSGERIMLKYDRLPRFREELENIYRASRHLSKAVIKIKSILHKGVRISIGINDKLIEEDMPGPLLISFDSKTESLRIEKSNENAAYASAGTGTGGV